MVSLSIALLFVAAAPSDDGVSLETSTASAKPRTSAGASIVWPILDAPMTLPWVAVVSEEEIAPSVFGVGRVELGTTLPSGARDLAAVQGGLHALGGCRYAINPRDVFVVSGYALAGFGLRTDGAVADGVSAADIWVTGLARAGAVVDVELARGITLRAESDVVEAVVGGRYRATPQLAVRATFAPAVGAVFAF